MTWPPQATRAEVLRLLEQNREFATWVISREETEVLIGLLATKDAEMAVVEAAKNWDGAGALKIMHVLTCQACADNEASERWQDLTARLASATRDNELRTEACGKLNDEIHGLKAAVEQARATIKTLQGIVDIAIGNTGECPACVGHWFNDGGEQDKYEHEASCALAALTSAAGGAK